MTMGEEEEKMGLSFSDIWEGDDAFLHLSPF